MRRRLLISMYSLHIGGAERSLLGLLNSIDYETFEVDLFLYRHEGELMDHLPEKVRLLPLIPEYTAVNRPIRDLFRDRLFALGFARILAKLRALIANRKRTGDQGTYKQMQYIWKYALPFLPPLEQAYDAAISFLGPHDFIVEKVKADVKIGWVHTDYSTIVFPDERLETKMWDRIDYIVNVSPDCEASFLRRYPQYAAKSVVIENILSPSFIREQAEEDISDEILQDGSFTICSVGRLSEAKGFDMAVEACKQAVELGYDLKWYVIGYGSEEEKIKKRIAEHGLGDRFFLLGKKTNPYPYIKACDLYCQPSRYEGKAVTVREAQILGKPVLITRYPTSSSQLRDGVDGRICELSVEGIRDGIIAMMQDAEGMRQLAEHCVQTDYHNESEVQKLYRIILEAREGERRREAAI